MMEREEELLRTLPLRAPSGGLDARIGKLLSAERPRELRVRPAWRWAAACAACAALAFAAGMFAHRHAAQPASPGATRYVIQVEQGTFDVFDWTKYPKDRAPRSILQERQKTKKDINKT
jgi:hypothetical protein